MFHVVGKMARRSRHPHRIFTISILVLITFLMLAVGCKNSVSGENTSSSAKPASDKTLGDPTPVPAVATTKPSNGPALDRIRSRDELLVGMDTGEPAWDGTPPMFFPNEKKQPDGFDYRVAEELAKAIGVTKVKLVHGKYSELPSMLTDKSEIDVVVSGYVPADIPGIKWSDPYLEFGLCLVVPAKSQVKTVSDLFGKAIGIFDDDAAAKEVARLVKGYTRLDRLEDGYWDALLGQKFAGFIYDYPYAIAEINDYYAEHPNKKGAFRIAQYNLTDSTYAVGVRATEPELLQAVNQGIKSFRDSERYRETIKKYLSGGAVVDDLPSTSSGKVYVVVAGDTLTKIAARELQDASKWKTIWDVNKSRIPNPNLIEIGDKLAMP